MTAEQPGDPNTDRTFLKALVNPDYNKQSPAQKKLDAKLGFSLWLEFEHSAPRGAARMIPSTISGTSPSPSPTGRNMR